jgi:hypothetical protein
MLPLGMLAKAAAPLEASAAIDWRPVPLKLLLATSGPIIAVASSVLLSLQATA